MFSVILKIINVKVKKHGSCPRYYRPFIFSCESLVNWSCPLLVDKM